MTISAAHANVKIDEMAAFMLWQVMARLPEIACVILAGGASRRFGTDKGLAQLKERPLISHVQERLAAQTSGPIVLNADKQSPYAPHFSKIIEDIYPDYGPLGGLHTALAWAEAQNLDGVITAPVDTPFLPDDYIARLSASGDPAIAVWGRSIHPVCAYWPSRLRIRLDTALKAGLRKVQLWSQDCNALHVDFCSPPTDKHDPFFNVNTVQDLNNLQARR